MATVVNDRDVLLLGTSQRNVNSQDATILITSDSPTFHVSATGTTTPSYITVTAHLLNIVGTASFTAAGATITDNGNNTATVAWDGMTGSSAVVTASITVNGSTFNASTTLTKVVDGSAGQAGASANWVEISTLGGQVFSRTTSTATFAPTSIALNATPYGNNATAYQWQYWDGSTWVDITGETSATHYVNSGDFTASRNYRVQATINGNVYLDEMTLVQVTGGTNSISGFLTNQSIALAADSEGNVGSFASATGTFKVYDGTTEKTGTAVTYSVVTQTNCTASIASTGVYNITAMTADTASVVLQAVYNGVTIPQTVTLAKSKTGTAGVPANQYAVTYLYQWSSSTPASPTGSSNYNWSTGANTGYVTNDGWSMSVPTNPGTPNLKLYVAIAQVVASSGTTSSTVSYSSASVQAWTQNGGTGPQGASGVQAATATVFQWAVSIPAGPSGTSTYTWSGGAIGTVPSGWSTTAGTSPSAGMTLWAAKVYITDSATVTQTSFNWTSASISAVGYAGTTGAQGASYVTAYCASATATTNTAPDQTTGKTSIPATNDGGITGTWSSTVPSLTSGQYLYQTDGIYDPTTDKVTWSIPYWSSLKVGSLSAITTDTGTLNVSGTISSANGNFTVDNNGGVTMKSATIQDGSGNIILQAGVALGSQTSQVSTAINSAALSSFSPYSTWDFTGSIQGWAAVNGATLTANTDSITITSTNVDPILESPGSLGFSGSKYDKVRVRIRRLAGSGWDGSLYFDKPGGVGEGTLGRGFLANPNLGSNVWTTLEWDLSTVTGWTSNTIDHIRLDFGSTAQDVFEIDWVSIGRYGVGSDELSSAAATAQADADAANAAIAAISSDSVLSKAEKPQMMIDVTAISDEKPGLVTQCGALGVDSGPYQTAYNALSDYLGSLSPAWNDTTQDTSIDGVTFRTKFTDYYTAKQGLVNDIASKASTMASGVTLSASGVLQGAGGGQVTLPGMGHNVYRVITVGNSFSGTLPANVGLYINGVLQQGTFIGRSYTVIVLDRGTGNIVSATNYDVYGVGQVGGLTAANMAADLNALTSDKIVLVVSYDEPYAHRLDSGLDTAMYRCGASRAVYGSPSFKIRSAYVLVGIPGCGEGNGAEAYQGSIDSDPNAWVDIGFGIVNGILTGVSVNYRPRTLADYSYTGDLNATYGSTWTAVTGAGKPADNATVGATLGTDVNGQITSSNSSTLVGTAAIQSVHISDLRTTNYAEDGAGNPTAGAKMASSGTALKVAPNSFQVGTLVLSDYWFRLIQGMDGSVSTGRVIWRGNNDATTRGGAPNIACLSITPQASISFYDSVNQVFYDFVYHRYILTPTSYSGSTDNLDAMQQIHVQFFYNTTDTAPFAEIYQPCPSRTYDGASGIAKGGWHWSWRTGAGQNPGNTTLSNNNQFVYARYLRVRIGNSYGWSATQDFAPGVNTSTALTTTTITGVAGSSGGGSGSQGGACPAPWVKVRLLSGRDVNASDLHNGAFLAAVNDSTMEALPKGGIVRDLAMIWAQRYRVKLTDGSVTEWSENHRFATVDRGWVAVQNLRGGDQIMGMRECVVDGVLAVGEGQVVSFRVEGAGTYFAGGMLCHNTKTSYL